MVKTRCWFFIKRNMFVGHGGSRHTAVTLRLRRGRTEVTYTIAHVGTGVDCFLYQGETHPPRYWGCVRLGRTWTSSIFGTISYRTTKYIHPIRSEILSAPVFSGTAIRHYVRLHKVRELILHLRTQAFQLNTMNTMHNLNYLSKLESSTLLHF